MATTSARVEKPGLVPGTPPAAAGRLMSLDIFRGMTIAAMILVNDPGDGPAAYWPLKHSAWNGWTPTDLVFPFFLFIVGVAMAFSFTSRLQRGDSRAKLLGHVLFRALILFTLGVFLNGFPTRYDPAHLRIYGVLQRIAICYVITAILELWTEWRVQLAIAVACLAGYWLLMRYMSVPGFGVPTHDIPLLDPDRNIVAWLDRKLLMGHLYEGARDPEGLLSTIPAVATCVAGLLTGKWLKSVKRGWAKTVAMAAVGVALVILGEITDAWFPINKKLWTSSYVILTAGLALVCLALCHWLVDVKRRRGVWTTPILVLGRNAIAAYFFSEALAASLWAVSFRTGAGHRVSLQELFYSYLFEPIANPANASLLYALAYVAVCWLVMAALYRKGVFLKV
jgi:predicted acyltransferase